MSVAGNMFDSFERGGHTHKTCKDSVLLVTGIFLFC